MTTTQPRSIGRRPASDLCVDDVINVPANYPEAGKKVRIVKVDRYAMKNAHYLTVSLLDDPEADYLSIWISSVGTRGVWVA